MQNNLILTGFIAGFSGLQEADAAQGSKYQFLTLELRTDEPMPQTPVFFLSGALAVQLCTCRLTPQTQLRVYFRLYSREYEDHEGAVHKTNEVSCWKVEVLDAEGHVTFTARRS